MSQKQMQHWNNLMIPEKTDNKFVEIDKIFNNTDKLYNLKHHSITAA